MTPHTRFSKMIFLNAKNSESALLAEPHGAVMFSCRTLTFSAKQSCRTLEIAEPKALKDNLAEPWNAGSFRVCPSQAPLRLAPRVRGERAWATAIQRFSSESSGSGAIGWQVLFVCVVLCTYVIIAAFFQPWRVGRLSQGSSNSKEKRGLVSGSPNRGQRKEVTPILSDLRRFWPIFAGVLQTLENKAPILFNFAPILSDLAFLQIRQSQTKSARPLRADPFWEFLIVGHVHSCIARGDPGGEQTII